MSHTYLDRKKDKRPKPGDFQTQLCLGFCSSVTIITLTDEGSWFLRNVEIRFPTDAASYPRTVHSATLPWKSKPRTALRSAGQRNTPQLQSSEVSSRQSPRSPRFNPRPIPVRFVVDKLALGRGFLRALRFSPSVSLHKVSTLILQLLLSSGQTGKVWETSIETGDLADIGKQEEKKPTFEVFRCLNRNRFYMIGYAE